MFAHTEIETKSPSQLLKHYNVLEGKHPLWANGKYSTVHVHGGCVHSIFPEIHQFVCHALPYSIIFRDNNYLLSFSFVKEMVSIFSFSILLVEPEWTTQNFLSLVLNEIKLANWLLFMVWLQKNNSRIFFLYNKGLHMLVKISGQKVCNLRNQYGVGFSRKKGQWPIKGTSQPFYYGVPTNQHC